MSKFTRKISIKYRRHTFSPQKKYKDRTIILDYLAFENPLEGRLILTKAQSNSYIINIIIDLINAEISDLKNIKMEKILALTGVFTKCPVHFTDDV